MPGITEEEYLAIERATESRSEFLEGDVFAMAGGTAEHVALQAQLVAELGSRLRGRERRVYTSDMQVKVSQTGLLAYPDVSIVCGPPRFQGDRRDLLLNPAVIFEVLSPSSESYDRGLKFQHYRTLESLREYVLVDQRRMRVEQFTRQPDNTWTLRDHTLPSDELRFDWMGIALPLAAIYSGLPDPAGADA